MTDKDKVHQLIKSDDPSNKLIGFTIGRQIGLSDLELFDLTKDGGFDYPRDVGPEVWQNLDIKDYSFYLWKNGRKATIYHKHVTVDETGTYLDSNMSNIFTKFLNLII